MMTSANAASPTMTMLHMATGCWVSQAIHIAAKLGIADLLQDGEKACEALAVATQTHAGALYRLLRALASLGVFSEIQDGHFQLTPLAECLRTNVPGSLRGFAIMLGEEEHWRSWGEVLYSVRTGQPAFDHVFGVPQFRYFAEHPEAARLFNEAMMSRSGPENDAVISAYDFSSFGTVIDVGGGQGTLLATILQATANARGVLFDLPHVIASARTTIGQAGQSTRCEFTDGNFFDAVPSGGDAYLLKKIIHDWDDNRAISILQNCRRAIPRAGRLLLIEPIIPPGNCPSFNKLLDLLMLVWTGGGKERTEAEHLTLLASAGFELARIIPTASPVSIIEAVPADR
jgi:hypothetical protein